MSVYSSRLRAYKFELNFSFPHSLSFDLVQGIIKLHSGTSTHTLQIMFPKWNESNALNSHAMWERTADETDKNPHLQEDYLLFENTKYTQNWFHSSSWLLLSLFDILRCCALLLFTIQQTAALHSLLRYIQFSYLYIVFIHVSSDSYLHDVKCVMQ